MSGATMCRSVPRGPKVGDAAKVTQTLSNAFVSPWGCACGAMTHLLQLPLASGPASWALRSLGRATWWKPDAPRSGCGCGWWVTDVVQG